MSHPVPWKLDNYMIAPVWLPLYNWPSVGTVTLNEMGKYDLHQTTTEHN